MSERRRRYAALAVRAGANVERGQLVEATTFLEHAPLVRAVDGDGLRPGGDAVPLLREDAWLLR